MKKILLALMLGAFSLSADAYDSYYVPETGNPLFMFKVYGPGESVIVDGKNTPSTFVIPQEYIIPILKSAENWGSQLGISPVTTAIYTFTSENEYNASAESLYVTTTERPFDPSVDYKVTAANAKLHDWTFTPPPPSKMTDDANVSLGLGVSEKFPGWQPYTGKHAIFHGYLPDLYAVMNHEIMHSLGLSSAVAQYDKGEGVKYYFSKDASDPLSIYDAQLRIYTGTSNPIDDSAHEMVPTRGGLVGPGGFDAITYSPYFAGKETIKVLGGDADYNTARQNIVDKGGLINYSDYYPIEAHKPYPTVYGLPIHPTDDAGTFELSHIELRNSYMSHQDFRNWLVPMEAELALLNDIGYNINLRKYFGKSYYLSGKDINHMEQHQYYKGFSELSGNNYTTDFSTIDQAVGIHIYGDFNDVIQRAPSPLEKEAEGIVNDGNILMNGEGSIGVRIDGVNDTYTLNSGNIYANGKENIGIAVTYGHGHNISINSGTAVTATGENSIAASFDFGANLFGTADSNIKGSYINYVKGNNVAPDVANQGELVTNFNIGGTLEGSEAAIYISDNAYVKNINVEDGAKIKGDIISEWNSVVSLGKATVQTPTPNTILYTNLEFKAPPGGVTNKIDVNGNITGDNGILNTLKMTINDDSVVDFSGNEINVYSFNNEGYLNISKNSVITTALGKINGGGNINILSGASLNLSPDIYSVENTLSFNNSTFNMANASIDSIHLSDLNLSGINSLNVDIDIAAKDSDTLYSDNITLSPAGGSLQISKANLMNANKTYTDEEYYIPFISAAKNNQNMLGLITLTDTQTVLTPIFKYNLGYTEDDTQGGFLFLRGAMKKYDSYNPAVVASSVAAQFGGYLNQLNSYEQAFQNLDMKMLMTREERQAYKMANLYASTVTPTVYSPTYLPEKDKGAWFRPYATFEKVGLRNGPRVENISYGSYFGGDSPVYETKNGWDYQYSVYAGYNGSHQNYASNSIYQNGGNLGATAIWYKNDFFTALTANVGASVAEASTMYGSEDMTMLMTGIASKTGYNWELSRGKFIIQPSFLMSYSFVNTFDYTNAAGLKIKSDPLNAINIAPGLKFIGNLKNGWQPYAGVQMVWNIMDKTDFKANNVALPDMSVKPYVQYGVGIQKRWGDRFTGFFQTMLRNGGRNGVALSFGFRWALGK